jgi:acylphosphatase
MKKRLIIKGPKVQDVGYRLFLFEIAESNALTGFQARNISEGVEILIEGEESNINNFVKTATTSFPPHAQVEKIITEDYEGIVMSIENFYRLFTLQQLVKMATTGIELLNKQDTLLEKQDQMLEKQDIMIQKQDIMIQKQDIMIQKQDQMLEKQDQMLKKQDQMLEKQDIMLKKQDQMLEKQDQMLEKQDQMLKKQDQMLEKQDIIIKEIRGLRED